MRRMIILLFAGAVGCASPEGKKPEKKDAFAIPESTITHVIDSLRPRTEQTLQPVMEKGVRHAASLWRSGDGSAADFSAFCSKNYLGKSAERELLFNKLSRYFESLYGHINKMTLDLRENVDLNNGPLLEVDKEFSGYAIGAHLQDDLYANKIAFVVALNFPYYPLKEKEQFPAGTSRLAWAMARMGDQFVSRVPAELLQASGKANADADLYISEYNIMMGKLVNDKGEKLFPDNMVLLSHWNLRDEIKACYSDKVKGNEKQEMIYQVMQRIVSQEIPAKVVNNASYEWNPFSNKVSEGGKEITMEREPDTRYQQILNNFKAERAIDAYNPELNTFIERKFSGEMEIPQDQVEKLFDEYLRSPQLKQIAQIIEGRLGRKLRPYDIWYDGFKMRSTLPQEELNKKTTTRYPNPAAFEKEMPNLLQHLGWSKERSEYLASKIQVDPARGSGHAAGASMKGEKAHLRTRIPATGMDYKGYNIAVHEFGHNVEQTISLYDVDYYMMNGVPNTAFTEALAFIFQSRDLKLLGYTLSNPEQERFAILDSGWSLMEIMGVGMVDMKIWKWLYAHPEATAEQLKVATMEITKEVWNTYFEPIFNIKDQTILGIYSHMVSNPLYLAAYSYGQIIEFQLEEHLTGKNFANEIDRIFKQGRLIPQRWMEGATGNKLSVKPLLSKIK